MVFIAKKNSPSRQYYAYLATPHHLVEVNLYQEFMTQETMKEHPS